MATYSFTQETNGFTLVIEGLHSYTDVPISRTYVNEDVTIEPTATGVFIQVNATDYYTIDLSANTVELDGVEFAGTIPELITDLEALVGGSGGGGGASSFADLTGSPSDNAALEARFDTKADKTVNAVFNETSIAFNKLCTYYGAVTVDSNFDIFPDLTDALPNNGAIIHFIGNGIHTPVFNDMRNVGTNTFDNTDGIDNVIFLVYNGVNVNYSILDQLEYSALPVLSQAAIEVDTPNIISLTYDKLLDSSSVPATSDFAVSPSRTVTDVSISGSQVIVTLNTPYVYTDSVTINYVAGTNPIRVSFGNNAANLTSQAVSNNIGADAPILESATTSTDGLIVELDFDKDMASPVGKHAQFTLSGGKTATAAALKSGDITKIQLTVSSAYLNTDVITVSYTPGDVESSDGGILEAFTNQSVTNVVTSETNGTFTLSNLTQSGTEYTGNTGSGYSCFGVASQTLTGDGYVVIDIPNTTLTDNGILGLSTSATNDGYTNWIFNVLLSDPNYKTRSLGGTVTDLGVAYITNDRVRIKRVGTTVTIEYYRGGSWNVIHTFPDSSTGTLYFHIQQYEDFKIYNPKISS